jgi:hypothetical protein
MACWSVVCRYLHASFPLSRLWGSANAKSDYDFLVVVKVKQGYACFSFVFSEGYGIYNCFSSHYLFSLLFFILYFLISTKEFFGESRGLLDCAQQQLRLSFADRKRVCISSR